MHSHSPRSPQALPRPPTLPAVLNLLQVWGQGGGGKWSLVTCSQRVAIRPHLCLLGPASPKRWASSLSQLHSGLESKS